MRIIVESIILFIIIIDAGVESTPAHFCSTVELELLFSGIFIFAPQSDGPAKPVLVVCAVFLHARVADLIFTFKPYCEY